MLDIIALILTIIGGINWGLIGIFQFDLVAWIFGGQDAINAMAGKLGRIAGVNIKTAYSNFTSDNTEEAPSR